MAIADTAKLVVDLSLKGNFSSGIKASERSLAGLGGRITDVQGRAYKAGQQIGTGIQRTAVLAVAAVGLLVPALIKIAKEGQDAANVETIFAKAVSNSGKVSLANVAALRAQEEALLKLGGVDDELIKTEQTRLIQMGLTGDQILKITPLILDFSKATGVDLLTATKLAGKAVEGNTGALSRYGVQIDKAKAKVDPFAATVDALNKKFGGTTQALSGSLNTKLDVLREELKNVAEAAGQKVLPVMTRLVDIVGTRIVPAFGKFVDAILPRAIAGLNKLADALDSGAGSETVTRIIDTVQAVLPAIESGARITGQVIATAVHLFESLPPEIQSLAIAGLAINKLTGGLVTNIAGGLIGAVLKQLVSGVVNVNGAVVNVNGVPGGGGGGIPPVPPGSPAGIITPVIGAAVALDLNKITDMANKGVAAYRDALALKNGTPQKQGPPTPDGAQFHTFSQSFLTITSANGREDRNALHADLGALGGKITDDLGGVKDILHGVGSEFTSAIKQLQHPKTPAELKHAADELTKLVSQGHGDFKNTEAGLAALRKQLANTHDPKTAAELRADIAKVEKALPGRAFAAKEYALEARVLASHESGNKKIADLKTIEQALKDRGLPHAASVIAAKIEQAKRDQTYAQRATTEAIKDKDLSVHVAVSTSTYVSARDVTKVVTKQAKFGVFAG